jgi:hypothetical protein
LQIPPTKADRRALYSSNGKGNVCMYVSTLGTRHTAPSHRMHVKSRSAGKNHTVPTYSMYVCMYVCMYRADRLKRPATAPSEQHDQRPARSEEFSHRQSFQIQRSQQPPKGKLMHPGCASSNGWRLKLSLRVAVVGEIGAWWLRVGVVVAERWLQVLERRGVVPRTRMRGDP